jgi:hypothetical protein
MGVVNIVVNLERNMCYGESSTAGSVSLWLHQLCKIAKLPELPKAQGTAGGVKTALTAAGWKACGW